MLKSFSCSNYRNVNARDIKPARINILLGPNNSGKTNFIKALTFYSAMLKHSTEGNDDTDFLNMMDRCGWRHSKNYYANDIEPVSFEWHMDLDGRPINYQFAYQTGMEREDFRITHERLLADEHDQNYSEPFIYFSAHNRSAGRGVISKVMNHGEKNSFISVTLSDKASICSQYEKLLIDNSELYNNETIKKDSSVLIKNIESAFRACYQYSSSEINTKEMRKRADAKGLSRYLQKSGANYANLFNAYRNESLIWKRQYVSILQHFIRDLDDIDVRLQRDDLQIGIIENGKEYDLSDVSEGTIKILFWTLLLCPPEDYVYELLAIDEPENNLHPAWLHVLADTVLESRAYRQCFISTHSPDFLDNFTSLYKETEDVALFVFDGMGNVKKIEYHEIAEDMGDWQIGDLYRTSDPAMGGWPW